MNNQYILVIKYKHVSEAIYLSTDREFLERLVEDSVAKFEYARLYKIHYPLTSLVKSWKKEDNE